MMLIGTTIPGENEPCGNGNVGLLHTSQRSRTGASPSDSV